MAHVLTAAGGGVRRALAESLAEVARLAAPAEGAPASLTRSPPLGVAADRYGDVAPLGPALLALRRGARALRDPALADAAGRVRAYLRGKRRGGLWPYHTGSLTTSIDSSLVLLGVRDRRAVQRLEAFRADGGGYVPQHCTRGVERGKMTAGPRVLHWCQPDYSIACLVAHLRARAGAQPSTPAAYFHDGFDTRAGLYIANPYLMDWFAALGLSAIAGTDELRGRLAAEVLAGMADDGGFGTFDRLGSTAAALLALHALNVPARGLRRSHARLAELWASRADAPPSRPFYSSERFAWSREAPWTLMASLMNPDSAERLIRVNGEEHVVTLYEDGDGVWTSSMTALALLQGIRRRTVADAGVVPADADARGASPANHQKADVPVHPRYTCATQGAYIAGHALPPYIRKREEDYHVPG
ncbi:hypothetical protein [Longimicrobium terrae]|uniref:Prenyltransferase n=1 Tax=Longimicrobium terrae TaxID=1639882 RepID=A0A841H6B4_9BACT|nr:hypothetical protein [Longimicrobium terrae]MBB4639443.1 hypothetical protein [Longimicrobium terrae]MBB6073815.1 hypothetical protein [Longimicrobium terrae]NNC33203.1 hypothetical protein [Longimicrobium terrae]